MTAKFARLQRIEDGRPGEDQQEFLHHLQLALLLGLRDRERLTAAQYRRAAERLYRQQREGT